MFEDTISDDSDYNLRLFETGEIIFLEGSESDKAYVIESGLVEIFVGDEPDAVQLNILGAGEIFGEMGLIDSSPRSASARALTQCYCVVMSASQIAERINSSSPIVQLLVSILLHRNRAYNDYLKVNHTCPKITLSKPDSADLANIDSSRYRKVIENIKLESDLQNAIHGEELTLHYQPLLRLKDSSPVGFEALLRWHSPARGMVLPKQFIELAEETSLMIPIGSWILERAFSDLRHFQDNLSLVNDNPPELFMSVNISVRQFQEPGFFQNLVDLANKCSISPHQIKLEVTERIFLEGIQAITAIEECRSAGFEVALDDFGTGYSSLNYLERCEIDSLKIDQSFTRKLCTSERAKIIVSSIIEISTKLGLPTVAEGIETVEQMVVLQELGCDIGQGYLFSRPVDFRQALTYLKQQSVGSD
jgi:EAL domain-containing protein (putative c-di-GMP-specific phosphodiesterase class I)/CRP-like cAMP-binding protein